MSKNKDIEHFRLRIKGLNRFKPSKTVVIFILVLIAILLFIYLKTIKIITLPQIISPVKIGGR